MAREGEVGEGESKRESWWEEGVTRAGVESREASREGRPPMVLRGGGEEGGQELEEKEEEGQEGGEYD